MSGTFFWSSVTGRTRPIEIKGIGLGGDFAAIGAVTLSESHLDRTHGFHPSGSSEAIGLETVHDLARLGLDRIVAEVIGTQTVVAEAA